MVDFSSFTPEPVEIYMISFIPNFRELSIQFLVKSLIFDGRADFEQLLFLNVRSSLNAVFFIFRRFWYFCFTEIKTLVRGEKSAVAIPSSFFCKTSALKRTSCFIPLRLIFGWSSVVSTASGASVSYILPTVVEMLRLSLAGDSAKEMLATDVVGISLGASVE